MLGDSKAKHALRVASLPRSTVHHHRPVHKHDDDDDDSNDDDDQDFMLMVIEPGVNVEGIGRGEGEQQPQGRHPKPAPLLWKYFQFWIPRLKLFIDYACYLQSVFLL